VRCHVITARGHSEALNICSGSLPKKYRHRLDVAELARVRFSHVERPKSGDFGYREFRFYFGADP